MKVATRILTILTAIAMPLVLAACGAPHFKLRAKNVYNTSIIIATPPVTNIDPVTSVGYANHLYDQMVYQTLLGLTPHGQAAPELAKYWTHNRRSTRYTLTLNPFAKWWSGRPVTASDVVWSLQFEKNPLSGFPRHTELSNLASIAALSPTRVAIRLRKPDPNFARNDLSTRGGLWILPSFLLKRLRVDQVRTSDYLNNLKDVVGDGPFRPLRQSAAGLTWAAYPHYFLGAPHTKYLGWTWQPHPALAAHPHGVDLIWSESFRRRYASGGYTVRTVPSHIVWALVVNTPGVPWLKIAKAATNRDELPGRVAYRGRWRTPTAHSHTALAQTLDPLGYTWTGKRWVGPGGQLFSIAVSSPNTAFADLLLHKIARQWRARGIQVTIAQRRGGGSPADLRLEPILLRPSPESFPITVLPLVEPAQHWYIARILSAVTPNPWEPFSQVAQWQVLRRRKS
jgi:hypothetical protein